jgi:sugar lactone lactonase YvrE
MCTALVLLFCAWHVSADLLVTWRGYYGIGLPEVLRYNETTGAFMTNFTHGGIGESMEGGVFGPDGNFYVTSNTLGYGSVLRFDGCTGIYLGEFISPNQGGLTDPYGLRFGPDGNLYVCSVDFTGISFGPGRILRYNGTNGVFLDTFVQDGAGGLSFPFDLVFGPDGNLYVTDPNYMGGGGLGVLRFNGESGEFLGAFVPRDSGGLYNATGLVFGPDGNLYVSSYTTHSVLRYNGTNGVFIDAFVPASTGGLDSPAGLAFGPDGRLYVCDAFNHVVVRYDGKTGAFVDVLVAPRSGGLSSGPNALTFTPRGPRLQIVRSMDGVVLSWPCSASNYVLETSGELAVSNNWVAVRSAPVIVGGQLTATNPPNSMQRFFRLRKQ